LCFNCLHEHQSVRGCRTKSRCQMCHQKHHTTLCHSSNQFDKEKPYLNTKQNIPAFTHVTLAHVNTTDHHTGPVLLKTATNNPRSNNNKVTVNILLDEGAQRTFGTETTLRSLNVETSVL